MINNIKDLLAYLDYLINELQAVIDNGNLKKIAVTEYNIISVLILKIKDEQDFLRRGNKENKDDKVVNMFDINELSQIIKIIIKNK